MKTLCKLKTKSHSHFYLLNLGKALLTKWKFNWKFRHYSISIDINLVCLIYEYPETRNLISQMQTLVSAEQAPLEINWKSFTAESGKYCKSFILWMGFARKLMCHRFFLFPKLVSTSFVPFIIFITDSASFSKKKKVFSMKESLGVKTFYVAVRSMEIPAWR